MKVNYNEFQGIVYGDLFSYPLTKRELKKLAIGKENSPKMEVERKEAVFYLPGKESLVRLRKEREKYSKEKLARAIRATKILGEIPEINGIFLTGSVAVSNADKDSDIDLMIVSEAGKLWQTRIKVLRKLKRENILRDKSNIKDRICVNIFLDTDSLEIKEKNLYTAHEILQAKCLLNRKNVAWEWLSQNDWVFEYLPNFGKKTKKKKSKKILMGRTPILEYIAYLLQLIYMKPKMTNEKVGLRFAFFHPIDGSKKINSRFRKKLSRLASN